MSNGEEERGIKESIKVTKKMSAKHEFDEIYAFDILNTSFNCKKFCF